MQTIYAGARINKRNHLDSPGRQRPGAPDQASAQAALAQSSAALLDRPRDPGANAAAKERAGSRSEAKLSVDIPVAQRQ